MVASGDIEGFRHLYWCGNRRKLAGDIFSVHNSTHRDRGSTGDLPRYRII